MCLWFCWWCGCITKRKKMVSYKQTEPFISLDEFKHNLKTISFYFFEKMFITFNSMNFFIVCFLFQIDKKKVYCPWQRVTNYYNVRRFVIVRCWKGMLTGPPREILQGGTKLLWGPGDRLRLFSKLRIWGPIKPLVIKFWPSWLQCKCDWW